LGLHGALQAEHFLSEQKHFAETVAAE